MCMVDKYIYIYIYMVTTCLLIAKTALWCILRTKFEGHSGCHSIKNEACGQRHQRQRQAPIVSPLDKDKNLSIE